MNWWVGMKDPFLQIMVHGDRIGETSPVIKYPGVKLLKVHKAESPNYLFLDLQVSAAAKPGTMKISFTKKGRTLYTHNYPLKQRKTGASQRKGFDASDVIYLVTPDRFVNGDPSNDVIPSMRENQIDRSAPGMRHGGDIRGIIQSLDYIQSMGFTAIWSQPLVENDMAAYSYHGYAITDHYKVDPRYGSLDDYKELADKAAARGIKIIYDGVVNHIGTGYWWMKDLPFRDWVNFPDGKTRTNHRRTINQDAYASAYDKSLMRGGWFDGHMADMNGANPFVAHYLIQNSIWWVETLSLGGIRQDTYCYSDKGFLSKWSCRLMKEYPGFNIVGEEWSLNPLVVGYWQRGARNRDGYSGCLPTVMDFPLQNALVNALKEEDDRYSTRGLIKLYEALANDFGYADPLHVMVFGDNHDMDRLYTQLGKDPALTKMAFAYLMTVRGIPQVYYGTEILMDNSQAPGDHGIIRSDLPGGWKGDAVNAFTGDGLTEAQKDMQQYVRKLLNWRKGNQAIAAGKTLHFAPFDGLYVFFRQHQTGTVMVVMNKGNQAKALDLDRLAEGLGRRYMARDVITGEQKSLKQLQVPARTTGIYELK
jgi:glycosidase